MEFLFQNKPIRDLQVLGKICFDILNQDIPEKPLSDEFCGVWVDGRNREINCIEDLASIRSFYLNSNKFYPLYLFCYNNSNILNGLNISRFPIIIVPIEELNSHESYSRFCINKLPFMFSNKYENLLYLQCDAFLIKRGWEEYLKKINCTYCGSPWLHTPHLEINIKGDWYPIRAPSSNVGNGAISYRSSTYMKYISTNYSSSLLREMGTHDKFPAEDLFFSFFSRIHGKLATPLEASIFSADPLTLNAYNGELVFGGHFPVLKDTFKESYLKI